MATNSSSPEAHRKAQGTYNEARKARGDRKMTFWISPRHAAILDYLACQHGSFQAGLEAALNAAVPAEEAS